MPKKKTVKESSTKKKSFKVTKKLVDKLMSFDSQTRGVTFFTDGSFVRNHYGEEALAKVEARLMQLGYPIKYDKVKNTEWLPSGLRVLSLLVIKEVLGLTDKDIIQMGNEAPKISFFIKLMAKFVNTIDLVVKKGNVIWTRQTTKGSLEFKRLGKNKLRIWFKDFDLHDIYLKYLQGYFQRFIKFIKPKMVVKCKLTKKPSKDRNYAEYIITW